MEKSEQIISQVGEDTGETGGFRDLPRRQVIVTMAAVMLAMFLSSMDQTVVGTAMPRIIADLGGFSHYTWVTTAYLVTSTAVLPIVGKLTDIYGRKWIYTGGIIIFLIGSILSGLSQSMDQLIIFRAFQGIGAGVMMANAFIVVADLFSPAERGKIMGYTMSVFGISAVIGPLLGGFLTDQLSWRWVFYVNIPFGIVAVVFFIIFFPKIKPVAIARKFDYMGVTTLVLSVVPLLLALSWAGSEFPWVSVQIIGTLVFAALMAVLFVRAEARADEPFIPLELFRNRIVTISIVALFFVGFAMLAAMTFIPLFFQGVLGSSATNSGAFLTPMMLGLVAGSVISGQAMARVGGHYRIQGLVGLAFMALGVFFLSRMNVNTSHGQAVFDIVIMGFGLGITLPIFTIAVQNAVPYRIMAVATSSTAFFRAIGGTLGLAITGSVMTSSFTSNLNHDVSADVKQVLEPGQLSSMAHNPQVLVSPEAQSQLQAQFNQSGSQGAGLFQQLMDAMKHALCSTLTEVFLIVLIAIGVAWLIVIFLKEIPLKGRTVASTEMSSPQSDQSKNDNS
jgi:EmrB/QacA subfamily drug resistance transporter